MSKTNHDLGGTTQVTALPHREVYWNVSSPHLKVYLPAALALSIFIIGAVRRVRMWLQGRKTRRLDGLAGRLARGGALAGSQVRVLEYFWPGLLHAALFFGFVVLFIGTLIVALEADFGLRALSTPSYFYWTYTIVLNLFGLLALAGVVGLLLRRLFARPAHLENFPGDHLLLLLILAILLSGHLLQAARLAVVKPWWAAYSFVSYPLALLLERLDEATLRTLHQALWWTHFLLDMAMLALIPYTKLLHIFTGWLALAFRSRLPHGSIKRNPAIAEILAGREDIDERFFGVGELSHLTWKNLLDSDACIRCGRCQHNCPAAQTGKQLNPKRVILDVRAHMERAFKQRSAAGKNEIRLPALQGEVIAPEVLWACTTCLACEKNCPMGIEHLDVIVPMRQYLVQVASEFPQELAGFFKGIENNSNPWQLGSGKRFDWAEGLDLAPLDQRSPEQGPPEVLFYVGCAGSYDPRASKVTRALVRVLQAAGVDFGVLGTKEGCCGETARRLGNEFLGQTVIEQNIEIFRQHGVQRIVTCCPHGYNAFKNDYPQFGAEFAVSHHSEFILGLLRQGRLQLAAAAANRTVVWHDSCYLGRYNSLYDEPRALLDVLPGIARREAARHGKRGFCCGAGGGRMWLEEHEGERINSERTRQLLATGADTIATACPYCLTMLEDGLKAADLTERVAVRDLAELVAELLPE